MDNESNFKGISVRAIIVFSLILCFSGAVFLKIENQTLNSLTMAVVGWYFGQKNIGVVNKNNSKDVD